MYNIHQTTAKDILKDLNLLLKFENPQDKYQIRNQLIQIMKNNHLFNPNSFYYHPYDPNIYEGSPSFRSNTVGLRDNNKLEDSNKNGGGKYLSPPSSSSSSSPIENVNNLNRILGEVESVLKGKPANVDEVDVTDVMNQKELNDTAAILLQKEMTAAPDTIKTKIDKYVIPVLSELSDALGTINKTDIYNAHNGNVNSNQTTTNVGNGTNLTNGTTLTNGTNNLTNGTNNITNGTNVNKTSTSKKADSAKLHNMKIDRGCIPQGLWSSNSLGIDLNLTILPNLMLKIELKSLKKSGIIDKNWFLEGISMSKKGGPLIIIGLDPPKRKIAVFIGQCKICQSEDYLFGVWTFSNCAAKCTDVWSAMESKMDVFKRICAENK
ncbi:conserved hypothetical protein [Pediculus humanus corporis]|uniref:Uncharacterized protein n=1 Tax=Pediculus humanus subsp. corporis TaxID=121224 RepID=E0VRV1_PEDHC|nr:uncharacterized protein Phum_PHUM405000 [Pediculus humanus corporis]EEB16107.1 conserved hypothetical protein [Pediculus humanus corporis]